MLLGADADSPIDLSSSLSLQFLFALGFMARTALYHLDWTRKTFFLRLDCIYHRTHEVMMLRPLCASREQVRND